MAERKLESRAAGERTGWPARVPGIPAAGAPGEEPGVRPQPGPSGEGLSSPEARDRLEAKFREELDELASELNDVVDRIDATDWESKQDYEQTTDDLKLQIHQLEGRLAQLDATSDQEWWDLQAEIRSELDELAQGVQSVGETIDEEMPG